jgi:rhamnosyltransferase
MYVSIIIRSYNDIKFLEKTLQAIQKQSFQDFEIINLDCFSDDGSWEVIMKYNQGKKYRINQKDYVPGKSLNAIIKNCKGKIIVFNNSDAIPLDEYWLENLIRPLERQTKEIATFANQIARTDAQPLVKFDYERAYGSGQIARNWPYFFSLASAAIKKDCLEQFPFDETIQYSEDKEWYFRIKNKGYKIKYVAEAKVEHSHNYTLKELWQRFYEEGKAEYYLPPKRWLRDFLVPFIRQHLRDIYFLIKHKHKGHYFYALLYRYIKLMAAYRGNRAYFNSLR